MSVVVFIEGTGTLPKSHSRMSCSSGGGQSAEPGGKGAEAVQVSEHRSSGSRASFPSTARHTGAVPSSPGLLSPAAALGTCWQLEPPWGGAVPNVCHCSGQASGVCQSSVRGRWLPGGWLRVRGHADVHVPFPKPVSPKKLLPAREAPFQL